MALFNLNPVVKAMEPIILRTPRWAERFLLLNGLPRPSRYKFAKGGRGSGKSHFFGEMIVDAIVQNPDCNIVCIREIQKSLKFSAKKLIEDKIYSMGYGHLFDIQETQIKRKGGKGIIIFMGMQDHTADSIKSLEGFDIAWVEEAQSLSKKSLDMLLPTIRKELEDGSEGSELWFTWNPYVESDAVDQLWRSVENSDDAIWAHVNYLDNPFCPKILHKEAERCRIHDPENYPNIWLGEYLTRTDDQVFGGKWEYADFDEEVENGEWDGPYHGMDFGFAEDPSTVVKVWRKGEDYIYIQREAGGQHIENTELARFVCKGIDCIEDYVVRADCSEPALISQLRKRPKYHDKDRGTEPEDFYLPKIIACEKWPGSVMEGVKHMQSYKKIYVHPDCKGVAEEMRLYKYKKNKGGDILPEIIDLHNHYIDAIRYALGPFIKDDGVFTDYGALFN